MHCNSARLYGCTALSTQGAHCHCESRRFTLRIVRLLTRCSPYRSMATRAYAVSNKRVAESQHPGRLPIATLRPQLTSHSQLAQPFGHLLLRRHVLVGSRTIRRTRRRYSQYSNGTQTLAAVGALTTGAKHWRSALWVHCDVSAWHPSSSTNPADLLCGSFGFSLDVVRTEAWRRGLMPLATNASPSRNIPVACLSRHVAASVDLPSTVGLTVRPPFTAATRVSWKQNHPPHKAAVFSLLSTKRNRLTLSEH